MGRSGKQDKNSGHRIKKTICQPAIGMIAGWTFAWRNVAMEQGKEQWRERKGRKVAQF